MSQEVPAPGSFAPQISFWCQIWQTQLEQGFRLWGYWAQFMPRESAAKLAAEAEAMKPVVRTSPAARKAAAATPALVKAPAKDPARQTAAKPAARPALSVAAETPAPRTTPAKKAPRTPVEAKAAPAKPTMH
ncbi:MAG: hypothetical protein KDK12_15775 [Rhodobacteraceae bacterium]|nr:hypothetical protein [Paracoccaceae bacterium]